MLSTQLCRTATQKTGPGRQNKTKSYPCCSVPFLRGSRLLQPYAALKVVKEASPRLCNYRVIALALAVVFNTALETTGMSLATL